MQKVSIKTKIEMDGKIVELKIKKVNVKAQIPKRATEGAAGFDLCACLEEELILQPMQRRAIPTGIALELASINEVALIFARSGMALKEGLAMANGVGVIDSDYRGEVAVLMINLSNEPIVIKNGQRIAQMLIMPVSIPNIVEVEELSDTKRAENGFGSTGKH